MARARAQHPRYGVRDMFPRVYVRIVRVCCLDRVDAATLEPLFEVLEPGQDGKSESSAPQVALIPALGLVWGVVGAAADV